jgi:Copper type II ascorbate-dependent monooxygenase, C-terminal domain/Copper type II ascorbate-dependent monooxygenase, N-terminal domain
MKYASLGLLGLAVTSFDTACSDDSSGASAETASAPTFYQDVRPLFDSKCVQCHQDGGIAPFSLHDYAEASPRANQIAAYTADRVMPPYLLETGGECGSFDESIALTDEQIALIGGWARAGALEGTPVEAAIPPVPRLEDGTDISIPEFLPQIVGGPLALFDEYRCFAVPTNLSERAFVTGYDVLPGNPNIVHHVLAFIVDPNAMSEDGSMTNQQAMDGLHAPSPDREGWPCFNMAGDNVSVESAPVTWAPGQGVVSYPSGMGVALEPNRIIVMQIHYNMADAGPAPDQTKLRMKLAPTTERQGVFLMGDDLIRSLYEGPPNALAPGQESVKFSWETSGADIGLPPGISLDVLALFPHMHGRGHKYTFEYSPDGGDYQCQGRVNAWNFNWQRIYDYTTPLPFTAASKFRVTCDYDTSKDTEPVLPGWGTRNEMCFVMLMAALPANIQP